MRKLLSVSLSAFVGAILAVAIVGRPGVVRAVAGGAASQNGDVNGDGHLDIADAVHLLIHMFKGGPEPVSCPDSPETLARLAQLERDLVDAKASQRACESGLEQWPARCAPNEPYGELLGEFTDIAGSFSKAEVDAGVHFYLQFLPCDENCCGDGCDGPFLFRSGEATAVFRMGDFRTRLVATELNDPDFAAAAGMLTNGEDGFILVYANSGGGGTFESRAFWRSPGTDFEEYAITAVAIAFLYPFKFPTEAGELYNYVVSVQVFGLPK